MSSAGSPHKQAPTSPSKRLKRKAADVNDDARPSTSVGRSRTTSNSPFHPASASSSSMTPSPVKRHSISSSSRRNSRQSRTFQISDDYDQDEDAPYDEELDADGEFDEDYFVQDGQVEEDQDDDIRAVTSSSAVTPARQSARPRRSNAPPSYAVPPLPSFSDDEHDQDVTPSIRRRRKKAKILPTSDVDADMDGDNDPGPAPAKSASRGTRTNTPSASKPATSKTRHRPSETDLLEQDKASTPSNPPEPEMSEEAKQKAKAEKEARDLQSRWIEEYFEIVEQLPLEMHRTFALMRELEGQMQTRVGSMVQNMVVYRDARMAMQKHLGAADKRGPTDEPHDESSRNSVVGAGSEDEAENLLGGSQGKKKLAGEHDHVEIISAGEPPTTLVLDKNCRRELLRSISVAANESVKAAEEKMGLAATAYNWIDRHIRRLDADISKLESSILLGLRSGTEESRGAREALGLPVDDEIEAVQDGEAHSEGEEAVSAEAESAAMTKAAGARKGSTSEGGRRSTRTTPKMGGQAVLAPSPKTSERALSRSRSRSTSTAAAAANAATSSGTRQPTSPLPTSTVPNSRSRARKPQPLSPQKGGRRSIHPSSTTTTVLGPDTSEMPFDPTEPTYCYCDQISFDEMVACDNDDCAIEWFHYSCVGLKKPPKKEWFCRFCAPKGWKGEGMDVPVNAKHKPCGWRKGVGIRG